MKGKKIYLVTAVILNASTIYICINISHITLAPSMKSLNIDYLRVLLSDLLIKFHCEYTFYTGNIANF